MKLEKGIDVAHYVRLTQSLQNLPSSHFPQQLLLISEQIPGGLVPRDVAPSGMTACF